MARPYLYDQAQLTRNRPAEQEDLTQRHIDSQLVEDEQRKLLSHKGEVDLKGSKTVRPRRLEPIPRNRRRDLDMNIGDEDIVRKRDLNMDDNLMDRTIRPESIDPYFESQLNYSYVNEGKYNQEESQQYDGQ